MSELHQAALLLLGFFCGVCWGVYLGKELYRRTLVLIANAGSAEKLPNGKFYYLIAEEAVIAALKERLK